MAEDKSHSSHFATGSEPRQGAELGPSFPCISIVAHPQRGAASRARDGLGDDHKDQQPVSYLGTLQPISWSWLGTEAWASSILPACSSGQGIRLTSPACARSSAEVEATHQPLASLAIPACTRYLAPPSGWPSSRQFIRLDYCRAAPAGRPLARRPAPTAFLCPRLAPFHPAAGSDPGSSGLETR